MLLLLLLLLDTTSCFGLVAGVDGLSVISFALLREILDLHLLGTVASVSVADDRYDSWCGMVLLMLDTDSFPSGYVNGILDFFLKNNIRRRKKIDFNNESLKRYLTLDLIATLFGSLLGVR